MRKRAASGSPEQPETSSSSPPSSSAEVGGGSKIKAEPPGQASSIQDGSEISDKGARSPRGLFVPNYEPIQTRKRAKKSYGTTKTKSLEPSHSVSESEPEKIDAKDVVQKAPRQRLRKDEVLMPDVGPRPKAVPKSLLILEPELLPRGFKKKTQPVSLVQIHKAAKVQKDASSSWPLTSQPEDSSSEQSVMPTSSVMLETDSEVKDLKTEDFEEGATYILTAVENDAGSGNFITVSDGHIAAVEAGLGVGEGQTLTTSIVSEASQCTADGQNKTDTPTSLLLLAEAAYPSTAGPHTPSIISPASQSPMKTLTCPAAGDTDPQPANTSTVQSKLGASSTFVTVACDRGASRIVAPASEDQSSDAAGCVTATGDASSDQWMCTVCGELVNKTDRQQHVSQHLDAEEEEEFMCETCGEQLRDEEDLELHMAVEHDEEEGQHDGVDFEEEVEDESTAEETEPTQSFHVSMASPPAVLTTATGTPVHTCPQCGDTFPFAAYLRQHLKEAHSDAGAVFSCSLCPKTFSSSSQLENHSCLHQTPGGRITFKCIRCLQCFSSAALLSSHARTCLTRVVADTAIVTPRKGRGRGRGRGHNRMRASDHACSICSKKFTSEVYLKAHELSHKTDTGDSLRASHTASGLQCLYCSERFRHIGPLKEHILASHPTAFPFKCSVCQRGFSRDSSRLAHEQTHQTEKMYFCNECGEGFTVQNYLNRHMKYRHLKLTRIPCRVCNKDFVRQADLIKHMRVHTGEKPYTCEICGHGFGQQSNYRYHMMRHRGQKPHVCPMCNKGFRVPSHLKMHMQQHLNERFSCQVCDKVFSQSRYLHRHMRTHTNARRVKGTTRLLPTPGPGNSGAMEAVMMYDNTTTTTATTTQPIRTEQQIIVDSVGDITEHVVIQDSTADAEPVIQFIFNDKEDEGEEKQLAVVDADGNTVISTPMDETIASDVKTEEGGAASQTEEAQAYVNADEGRSVVVGAFSEGEGGSVEEGNVTLPFKDLTQLLGGKHYNCDVCSQGFSIRPNSTYNMIHTGQSHILVISLNDHIHQEETGS